MKDDIIIKANGVNKYFGSVYDRISLIMVNREEII